ncbi:MULTISPECIES: methyltransferase domain-containing protein [Fischerella]|uniref:SAM-dependent methyltransferase n=1 Tax=Fischerella muscicola CCMEE 5323 TaxID=2019572 RepID=A0A2N6JV52_FISMU|nr:MULTISPECIES: methyltransferase domain-containing protein [Fischerella]MBD2433498.1 tRNA (adenine(22)-N(1))-methyltransferase TrmK [Fischerella sp. FACHB-380]PLZ82793.1 SAM-dependent methyltransferase [Fischerella muscicola CCMEE 5323]
MIDQRILLLLITGVSAVFGVTGSTLTGDFEVDAQVPIPVKKSQENQADVPYVPTPQRVVNTMLELAKVNSNDVVYDLGSGDGRIPITAVQKYNARRAVGVEINPRLVQQSRNNAQKAEVSDRVEFRQQDLFQTNLTDATVVTLYLLPDINLKLRPKLLKELKPGTRIVSHRFNMGKWKPQQVAQVDNKYVYLWIVPKNVPANLDD